MEPTEKQKAEEIELALCHKHIYKMLDGVHADDVNISVLLFCLEIEVHRMKGLIIAHTYARPATKDAGGMYQ